MTIVQELNESYFIERFREMGRGDEYTYKARKALYEYYDNLSDDIGEDIKLDVIAICCDWCESTIEQVLTEYSNINVSECTNDDEKKQAVIEYLEGNTIVIDCDDTVLYIAF